MIFFIKKCKCIFRMSLYLINISYIEFKNMSTKSSIQNYNVHLNHTYVDGTLILMFYYN